MLAVFKLAGVQLAQDEKVTREYYSNRFLGGERILNSVRRFKGTWLLNNTDRVVNLVGGHELTIENEKHQMRLELVGSPRRCYGCGQFGHIAADHRLTTKKKKVNLLRAISKWRCRHVQVLFSLLLQPLLHPYWRRILCWLPKIFQCLQIRMSAATTAKLILRSRVRQRRWRIL